jgi:endogenous inhibitor of DNA gyrase (YacG/DUF329 family)
MAAAPSGGGEKLKTHPCPKCGRTLVQSGELESEGRIYPTFQCEECVVTVDFLGETTEIALTFALDKEGQPFDPADPDGRLRF